VTTFVGVVRQEGEILQILWTKCDLVIEAKIKFYDITFMKVGLGARV
jgi:hypothetical protein